MSSYDLIVVGTQENSYKHENLKLGHAASKLNVSALKEVASNEQMTGSVRTSITKKNSSISSVSSRSSELGNIVEEEEIEVVVEIDTIMEEQEEQEEQKEQEGEKAEDGSEERGRCESPGLVDLKQATVLHNEWEVEICKHMGDEWSILEREAFGQMKLFILVHTGLEENSSWAMRNVAVGLEKGTSATGIGGVLNNKGGIVISFHLRNTYMSFVSAHLNAHMEHEKKRNSDHAEIRRETQVVGNTALDCATDVDHCIWMGDLNYRTDLNRSVADKKQHGSKDENWQIVKKMVDEKKYSTVLSYDQLNAAKKDGLAWSGFEEGAIHFAPTFKVLKKQAGEGHYKKQRVPSYCDRVLFKSAPHVKGNVHVKKYQGCPQVSTSDHKPVIADLHINVSRPPLEVYSFQSGGRRQKHRSSVAGVTNSEEATYHEHKRGKVWPVVKLSNLSGEKIIASDLDFRGKTSDPYVEFHSNPQDLLWRHPHKLTAGGDTFPPVTKILANTLNPTWADDVVPMLHPQITTQTQLDQCSLMLLLKDSDGASADDILGVVSLRFPGFDRLHPKNSSAGKEYSFDFDEPIDLNGCTRNTGRLKGTVTVSWTDEMRKQALDWYESETSDSCGCCSNVCQGGCQCSVQ